MNKTEVLKLKSELELYVEFYQRLSKIITMNKIINFNDFKRDYEEDLILKRINKKFPDGQFHDLYSTIDDNFCGLKNNEFIIQVNYSIGYYSGKINLLEIILIDILEKRTKE